MSRDQKKKALKNLPNKSCSDTRDKCMKKGNKMMGLKENASDEQKDAYMNQMRIPEACKTDLTCEEAAKDTEYNNKCAQFLLNKHFRGLVFEDDSEAVYIKTLRFLEESVKIIPTSEDPTAKDTSMNELQVTDNDVTVDGSTPSKLNTSTEDDYEEADTPTTAENKSMSSNFISFSGVIALVSLFLF